MSNIGFIGLGAMGAPMARHLLKGGHALTVWARRPDAMAPLFDAGARGAASASDVASRSDVIITMVIDTAAVEEVTLGSRGIEMLDAPVSGGAAVAEAGTLTIMAGGDEDVLERCRAILECDGKTIAHLGPSGAGLDPVKVKDVLMTGFVESRLHHKDIQIVLAMARALGIELPASAAAATVLTELQNRGGAKTDSAAVFTVLANPQSPVPNP